MNPEIENIDVSAIVNDFKDHFYSLVQQIPAGKLTTYGTMAEALGDKIAARAVGKMLNENPRPIKVPCHRVVMADGHIGGFGMGIDKKFELLKKEGVSFKADHVIDLHKHLFTDFDSYAPLYKLRQYQDSLREKADMNDGFPNSDKIAGVDVSYNGDIGFASVSLYQGIEEISHHNITKQVYMPYIPTYLAFRETEIIHELLNGLGEQPDILLVDGNGILHPRGVGLATQLGIEMDIPTIGVAKSLLLGNLEREVTSDQNTSKIIYHDRVLGYALLSGGRAKNPVYISPGHKITPGSALEIVKRFSRYKVPEPIRKAHMNANEYRIRQRNKHENTDVLP